MTIRNQIQGVSVLVAAAILGFFVTRQFLASAGAASEWVLVWAALEATAAFLSLSWAIGKSDKIFYSVFAAGGLLRLLSLGVATVILISLGLSVTIPLLTLAGSYFLFSIIQLPFLVYGLR